MKVKMFKNLIAATTIVTHAMRFPALKSTPMIQLHGLPSGCVTSAVRKTPAKAGTTQTIISKPSMINSTKGENVESAITEEEVVEDTAQESYGWIPCDSCRTAQAIWKVVGPSGELFFCGHHKNKMEAGLTGWANEFVEIVYFDK
jgi:hypothetical protein